MELGIYSFAEIGRDPYSGIGVDPAQRLKDLLEEIELADQVGLDVFGIGEHHRPEYAVSSPAVVLAAAAERTRRIRLTSAVTVLSSDDPIRVFQQFATVDLLSGGRAEIMAGRGSFIESYPLFGYDLAQYDQLFEEKLGLLLQIRGSENVSWKGKLRAPIYDQGVYPRPAQNPLPVWIAVGGSPNSVIRAAKLGLPLAIAIIGGQPERFIPMVNLFRDTAAESGNPGLPLGINSLGYIAETSQRAADEYFPSYAQAMNKIGLERGWPPIGREEFGAGRSARGALVVGSPQQAIDKILFERELFGMDRFLLQVSVGPLPHSQVMRAIELFGTQVAPQVRQAAALQIGESVTV